MDLPSIVPPKIPLSLAATDLAVLMNAIDNETEISSALVSVFGSKLEALKDAVDRRIMFNQMIKHTIEGAKEMRDAWTARVKTLEAAYEGFKENTKSIMESEQSVQYSGRLGTLALQNSPAALEVDFPLKTFHVSNVVPFEGDLTWHSVDPKYIETKSFIVLNKEKLKEDLAAGGLELTWARLKKSKHLRVRV